MKILKTIRPAEEQGKPMSQVERHAVLQSISVALMDHGTILLKSGTAESAAILQSWLTPEPEE